MYSVCSAKILGQWLYTVYMVAHNPCMLRLFLWHPVHECVCDRRPVERTWLLSSSRTRSVFPLSLSLLYVATPHRTWKRRTFSTLDSSGRWRHFCLDSAGHGPVWTILIVPFRNNRTYLLTYVSLAVKCRWRFMRLSLAVAWKVLIRWTVVEQSCKLPRLFCGIRARHRELWHIHHILVSPLAGLTNKLTTSSMICSSCLHA